MERINSDFDKINWEIINQRIWPEIPKLCFYTLLKCVIFLIPIFRRQKFIVPSNSFTARRHPNQVSFKLNSNGIKNDSFFIFFSLPDDSPTSPRQTQNDSFSFQK